LHILWGLAHSGICYSLLTVPLSGFLKMKIEMKSPT